MISSRLPDIGTSIFTVMSRMAQEENAINLSQGFPDFPIDEKLIRLVQRYMLEGHNQYAPMAGTVPLREAIARMVNDTYSTKVDPESQVTVTAGATQALFAAIAAFIREGDEVIVFDPSYDSYAPAIRLNGGAPVSINLTFPGYTIDWDLVRKRISAKTRMIIVNTPHNPTGAVFSDNDWKELEEIAVNNNLIVLSDEVYERLTFDGFLHKSAISLPGLADRSVVVSSFGKTFHATGWKVGYVTAAPALTTEIRKTHQFIVFSVNTPVQLALADYLAEPAHYRSLSPFYQEKRDFFLKQIEGSSFEVLPCRGSYFQLLSYRGFSKKSDVEMAEELTRKFKVASIPVSVFYKDRTDNRILRFCFAKRQETLAKACDILRKI